MIWKKQDKLQVAYLNYLVFRVGLNISYSTSTVGLNILATSRVGLNVLAISNVE